MLANDEITELVVRAIRIATYQSPERPDPKVQMGGCQRRCAENYRDGWDQGYAQALANVIRGLEGDLSFNALEGVTKQ